ncbi:Mediator of RNA polymerase II transcription subunit 32 [Linum perenne]
MVDSPSFAAQQWRIGVTEEEPVAVMVNVMDDMADSLNNAYQEFVTAAANVIETKELDGAQKTVGTDTLLENFKQKWELFRVACDQAEEIVESARQRIESECLVDEATGTGTATVNPKPGQTSLAPMSAVRLEQMSKAVRKLMIELQHGSGAAAAGVPGHAHPFPLFNA